MSAGNNVVHVTFGIGASPKVVENVIAPIEFPANDNLPSDGIEYGGTVNDRAACVRLEELLSRLQLQIDEAKLEKYLQDVKKYRNDPLFGWIAEARESSVIMQPEYFVALLAAARDRPRIDK